MLILFVRFWAKLPRKRAFLALFTEALSAWSAGGQSARARAINSKQQNAWFWLNKSGCVPVEFVLPIEHATQG